MGGSVVIPERFNGPPDTANGGYACGVVAGLVGADAQVTLRSPPPLGRELRVVDRGGAVDLLDGDTLVASGEASPVEVEAPAPVGFADAERAAQAYIGFHYHPFPTCFVCGPRRPARDGLAIFPGLVEGRDVAAAPWVPDASVCDVHGHVHPEVVWAALDCPSWFGVLPLAPEVPLAVLGRLAVRVDARPHRGERCVAVGWGVARDGRKLHSGSALFSEDRGLLAVSRATWVTLRA